MNTQEFAAWLREEMGKVQDKLDSTQDKIAKIDVTLASQAADVAYHIKRTDALEERVEQVAGDLKPVKDHVTMIKGIGAFLALATTVTGLILAARAIMG